MPSPNKIQLVGQFATNTNPVSTVPAIAPDVPHAEYLPTTVVPDGDPEPAVTLRPQAAAESLLIWNKYEGTGQQCPPLPATLDVSLSGDQHFTTNVTWLNERDGGSVCNGGHIKARYFVPSKG